MKKLPWNCDSCELLTEYVHNINSISKNPWEKLSFCWRFPTNSTALCKLRQDIRKYRLLHRNYGHSLTKYTNIEKFCYAIPARHIFTGRKKYSHSNESKYCIVRDLPRYLYMPTEIKDRLLFYMYYSAVYVRSPAAHIHEHRASSSSNKIS